MGAPNLFLVPGAIQPWEAPEYTPCLMLPFSNTVNHNITKKEKIPLL